MKSKILFSIIKKMFAIAAFLVSSQHLSYGQDPGTGGACAVPLSTHFTNPYNPMLPVFNPSGIPLLQPTGTWTSQAYSDLYLNEFMWYSIQNGLILIPDVQLSNVGTISSMMNPFGTFALPSPNRVLHQAHSEAIASGNPSNYMNYNPMYENGWELMALNTGRFPDDQTVLENTFPAGYNGNSLDRFPYMILYNRYTGTLRIFGNVQEYWSANNALSTVKITLSISDPVFNGTLRMANSFDQALDQPTSVKKVVAITRNPTSLSRWFHADFQLAYDPCVCVRGSEIAFDFDFFTDTEVKLYGRTIGGELIVNEQGVLNLTDFLMNFNQSSGAASGGLFFYNNMTTLLKDYKKRLEQYIVLQQNNNRLKSDYLLIKAVMVILNGFNNIPLEQPNPTNEPLTPATQLAFDANDLLSIADAMEPINPDLANDLRDIANAPPPNPQSSIKLEKVMKEAQKTMNKLMDMFIAEQYKANSASKPNPPVGKYSEMNIQGSISSVTPYDGAHFYTPGTVGRSISRNSNTLNLSQFYEYPLYNNPTGVFALLETPRIKISNKQHGHFDEVLIAKYTVNNRIGNLGNYVDEDEDLQVFNSYVDQFVMQFQLMDELKYAFNPSLNIKSTNVKASIVIRANTDHTPLSWTGEGAPPATWVASTSIVEINYTDINAVSPSNVGFGANAKFYNVPNWNTNIESTTSNIDAYTPLTSVNNGFEISTVPVELEFFSNTIATFGYDKRFQLPTLPNSLFYPTGNNRTEISAGYFDESYCTSNCGFGSNPGNPAVYSAGANLKNRSWANSSILPQQMNNFKLDYKVYLKLIVEVEFLDPLLSGDPSEFSYVFMYEIPDSKVVELNDQMINPDVIPGSSYDIGNSNLILNGVHFNGQSVPGCGQWGNTYICRSSDVATISGNILIDAPYNVIVIAENEINVLPESNIPPECILKIEPYINQLSSPMLPMNESNVLNWCNSTSYQAHTSRYSIPENSDDSIPEINVLEQKDPIEFTLFPNPTTGASQAGIYLPELATVSITIIDVSGKIVGSPVQNVTLANGRNVQNLETESLQPGVYLVHLVVNGEKIVQRLVKQ
jgi:hypothetical protein